MIPQCPSRSAGPGKIRGTESLSYVAHGEATSTLDNLVGTEAQRVTEARAAGVHYAKGRIFDAMDTLSQLQVSSTLEAIKRDLAEQRATVWPQPYTAPVAPVASAPAALAPTTRTALSIITCSAPRPDDGTHQRQAEPGAQQTRKEADFRGREEDGMFHGSRLCRPG